MDCFTPAASFRPSRPLTRTRHRARHMSPSPLPRRPFTEPSTLFISTDYDFISPSSPDSDLIFSMSPVHSHIFSPPAPNSDPVNVMTLRNKTETKAKSPPLSPLLYSFPRPSRLHPFMNKNPSTQKDIVSKPLSSMSQNTGVPTMIIDPRGPPTSSDGAAAGPRPFPINSFVDVSPLPKLDAEPTRATRATTPRRDSRSPHAATSSSPIPIPRHTPRPSDPGFFDLNPLSSSCHPISIAATGIPDFDATPYASSGIASYHALTGFADADVRSSTGAATSPDHYRVTAFDDADDSCANLDSGVEESLLDFSLSASDYSSTGSGPFRLAKFLGPDAEGNRSNSRTSSVSGQSATVLLRKIAAQKRMS